MSVLWWPGRLDRARALIWLPEERRVFISEEEEGEEHRSGAGVRLTLPPPMMEKYKVDRVG